MNGTIRPADRCLDVCASYSILVQSNYFYTGGSSLFFTFFTSQDVILHGDPSSSCHVSCGRSPCSLWKSLGVALHCCCLRLYDVFLLGICVWVFLSGAKDAAHGPQLQFIATACVEKQGQKARPDQFRSVWHN